MPSTVWSGPVPNLNSNSLVVSSFTTSTKTDLSPAQVILWPGMLSVGTRIRLVAFGNYITTTAASTNTVFGFYMNSTATNNIATTPAILAETAAATIVSTGSVAFPWRLIYYGQVRALTSPLVGATNAQIFGHGEAMLPTTLTAWTGAPIPITAALRTVQQTATGLVTSIPQTVMVGFNAGGVNTGITSVTCDELTCELLG